MSLHHLYLLSFFVTSPYLLDFYCCIMLKTLLNVFSCEVPSEYFLDHHCCMGFNLVLYILMVFMLYLCLVFKNGSTRMVCIQTQSFFSFWDLYYIASFAFTLWFLFFWVEKFIFICTLLPFIPISSDFRVLLTYQYMFCRLFWSFFRFWSWLHFYVLFLWFLSGLW